MTLDEITAALPEYAKDLRLNLSTALRETTLTDEQKWGTIACAAICCRREDLITAALTEAAQHMSEEALNAARGAASIMGMNNIYYRFGHLASNDAYLKKPAGLRMNIIRNHGVSHADFELWSLAASAVNGCGLCIDSHEKSLKEHDVNEDQIQAAVKLASIMHGIATAMYSQT